MTIAGGTKNPKLVCGRGKECGHSQPLEEGMLEAVANGTQNGAEPGDSPDDEAEAPKRGKDRAAAAAP
jgi:hypothetical protein